MRKGKLKKMPDDELERKILDEIIECAIAKDADLIKKKDKIARTESVLDALAEVTSLSREQLEEISGQVRAKYEQPKGSAPKSGSSRPPVLNKSLPTAFWVLITAIGCYLLIFGILVVNNIYWALVWLFLPFLLVIVFLMVGS
ncbi:MAG: hypothetical protein GY869_26800 [Planctomycetes bacterium]|nr:hypothetical protein [Planctomycetota bacterium]